MQRWVEKRDAVLAEMMRTKGKGSFVDGSCPLCPDQSKAGIAAYRCSDCHSRCLLCASCCVDTHQNNPLHRIKVCYIY